MQIKISNSASLREYRVGSLVEDIGNLEVMGYFMVRVPSSPLTFSFIEGWDCSWCGLGANWAQIDIVDGVIASIESVLIDADVVERCNYVSDMCTFYGWTVSDGKYEKIEIETRTPT
jgi:hypothetical protein